MLQESLQPTTLSSLGRERFSLTFLLLTVTFCVCLIISNLMEIKTVDLGFMTITAGVAVLPLSYIINDCQVEIYGFRKARLVIFLGFSMNLLTVLLLHLGLWLPGSDTWTDFVPLTKGTAKTNNYGGYGSANSFNTDTWTSESGKTIRELIG